MFWFLKRSNSPQLEFLECSSPAFLWMRSNVSLEERWKRCGLREILSLLMAEESATLRQVWSYTGTRRAHTFQNWKKGQLAQSKGIQRSAREWCWDCLFSLKVESVDNIVLATFLSGDVMLACCSSKQNRRVTERIRVPWEHNDVISSRSSSDWRGEGS